MGSSGTCGHGTGDPVTMPEMGAQLSAARRAEVLRWAQTRGVVQVNELARSMRVSPSTIRRDLSLMEEEGLLRRVHGGAIVDGDDVEPRRQDRAVARSGEKQRIAAAAGALIDHGSTILISGGTTTEAMLPVIAARHELTVVTNSLDIAVTLAGADGVQVVVLGGYLRRGEHSLLGHLTRRALDDLIVDRMFTGAFGLDEDGVTGANVAEAETDRHLMAAARQLVVMADSSKFGRRGPVRLAATGRISTLITDAGAPEEQLRPWRQAGVEVLVV